MKAHHQSDIFSAARHLEDNFATHAIADGANPAVRQFRARPQFFERAAEPVPVIFRVRAQIVGQLAGFAHVVEGPNAIKVADHGAVAE